MPAPTRGSLPFLRSTLLALSPFLSFFSLHTLSPQVSRASRVKCGFQCGFQTFPLFAVSSDLCARFSALFELTRNIFFPLDAMGCLPCGLAFLYRDVKGMQNGADAVWIWRSIALKLRWPFELFVMQDIPQVILFHISAVVRQSDLI